MERDAREIRGMIESFHRRASVISRLLSRPRASAFFSTLIFDIDL